MHIDLFDYTLPEELIAQSPTENRSESRLMVIDRKTGSVNHKKFYDVLDYLEKGDCLVLNNSRVLPARLLGQKAETGGKVEFLLTKRLNGDLWETMVRPGKRVKPGDVIVFSEDPKLSAVIRDFSEDGTRTAEFQYSGNFMEVLSMVGRMPLPPYIQRQSKEEDKERYQTVYSKKEGSVAAPTAGLHITESLLEEIRKKGIHLAYVTLHVGIGTFRPVKSENIEDHKMHFEEYEISDEAATLINTTKQKGGRIVAVGTTSTRTLESAAGETGIVKAGSGRTDIFIYPGYRFRVIDSLITNFHLPKSTLLMLISALYDRTAILEAYRIAVAEQYRFFSYGDAMLIL